MKERDLDLDALMATCEQEPIHAPGAIQPHGCLLGLIEGHVAVASTNTADILGVDAPSLLGRDLVEALGPAWANVVDDSQHGALAVVVDGPRTLECVATERNDLVLLEIEADPAPELDDHWRLYQALHAFHGAGAIEELGEQAVTTVRELTGFDRVMLYRFDEEWNGEVVAESVATGVESFNGLRYPASDIPAQARAQYARATLRLIPDSSAAPSSLIAPDQMWADRLDLSEVSLRAVSPVHLQYLRNMGVRASMSVSITVDGELWGLIACHHLTEPRRPSRRACNAVDLVARTTSTVAAVLTAAGASARRLTHYADLDELSGELRTTMDREPADVVFDHPDALLRLTGATGVALVGRGSPRTAGEVPPVAAIEAMVATLRTRGEPLLVEDHLQDVDPMWAQHVDVAAGALAAQVGSYADRWLVWFRPETARTVRWGGDPTDKVVSEAADGSARLSPRASFAEWVEQVRGRSTRWHPEQVDAAVEFGRRLSDFYAARSWREAELAARLQETLMLESFPPVPGIEGAARYAPSADHPLGGDWYDVFFRPDRPPILVLGDVAGHGFEVAGTMAQLRHALRAYLVREPSIEAAMGRLNELTTTLLPGELATLVLLELDTETRQVRLVNAGHLPPVVTGPTASTLIEDHGTALGLDRRSSYEATVFRLEPEERIVVYSDGLIERRSRGIDEGFEALLSSASSTLHLTVDQQCHAIAESLRDGSDVDDDTTVVIVGFTDGRPSLAGTAAGNQTTR